MVIQGTALVFRGVQHLIAHIFAVVELSPALIIHIHHQRFVVRGYRIVVQEFGYLGGVAPETARQLRVLVTEPVVVPQLHMEHIGAVLQILHPRLPEQVQQVHLADGDFALSLAVPKDLIAAGAGFELVPPDVGIGGFKVALAQHHRQNGAQLPGRIPVPRLLGQNGAGGIGVHGVGVLGHNDVAQPRRHRVPGGAAVVVAQLPPLLVVDDPPLQIGFAGLVAVQELLKVPHLRRADGRLRRGGVGFVCALFVHGQPPK